MSFWEKFSFKPAQKADDEGPGHELVLAMILSVLGCITLALILVWLNIERTKLAYSLRTLQNTASQKADIQANLRAERENLLSRLGIKAESLGLYTAQPGQVRRMDLEYNATGQVRPIP